VPLNVDSDTEADFVVSWSQVSLNTVQSVFPFHISSSVLQIPSLIYVKKMPRPVF
jgi:hypothetical protein